MNKQKSPQGTNNQLQNVLNVKDKWKIIPAFLRAKGLVKQHVDSFNYFVQDEIKQIVRADTNRVIRSDIDSNFFIEFIDVNVGQPLLQENMMTQNVTPMVCRLRDLTYSAPILVDIEFFCGNQIVRRKNVEIGKLPIMLKSCVCILNNKSHDELQALGECPHDPGGYFVVKGTEKVILMQEQTSKNRIIVEKDFKHFICATVTSTTAESKSRSQLFLKDYSLFFRHNSFVEELPLFILLKAMSLECDQEIFQAIDSSDLYSEQLCATLQDCMSEGVRTQKDALLYIGKRIKYKQKYQTEDLEQRQIQDEVIDLLHRVILSHLKTEANNFRPKVLFLCLMARRVLDANNNPSLIDDKDYLGNKRLELAGQLVSIMFEDLFKRFCSQTLKQANLSLSRYHQNKSDKGKNSTAVYPDCCRTLQTDIITRGLQTAMATGNWHIKRFKMERGGVTQVLCRFSYIAALGMMTRINSQVEKGSKCGGPRALQPSQWGLLCPCDTPEGEACGLVKNLSLMTHVTTEQDTKSLIPLLFTLGIENAESLDSEALHDPFTHMIFLNGEILGVHRNSKQFMNSVKLLRRLGKVGNYISIYDNETQKAVYIASDEGRMIRPLIICHNGQSKMKQEHIDKLQRNEINLEYFFFNGIIEWVDCNEENNLLISLKDENITKDTTHLEIDPLTLLGVIAGLIPYPHHNQSPRNTYQCAMGKQAIGAIAYNQFLRCDTVLYLLHYPQKPLCKSITIELTGYENLPAGQNASVAIMSYSGYDIEDAMIVNKDSLDRGYQRCFEFRKSAVEMQKYSNGSCDTVIPPILDTQKVDDSNRASNYMRKIPWKFQLLEEDGIAAVGGRVYKDQIYVNKCSPIDTKQSSKQTSNANIEYKPTPCFYKKPNFSFIDRVLCTENNDGDKIYKVMLRQTRRPEYGDKFSSRHGQKGVCGLIVPQIDMPFSENGWVPDLIMNPHGFPSRMTVGKMLELLAGKSAVLDGRFKYGTAFGGTKLEEMAETLVKYGYHYSGKDYLTSGITGESLQSYIFVGPIFYQRLKHMVEDKIHARGRGPKQILTRQPTEGRAKDGGLRLGEMERDCLVAYGAANLLNERLMLSSDVFEANICGKCGFFGASGWCQYCKSGGEIASVRIPYACKLLFQEMMAMNVSCRLKLSNS